MPLQHLKIVCRKIFLFLTLSQKINAGISVVFACLGASSYFFKDLLSVYLCNEQLYTQNFKKCVEPYEHWGVIFAVVFLSTSFIFAISILLRDRSLHRIYFKIFTAILVVGTLMAILLWDDSSGGFFVHINFGQIFLALTGIVFALSIFAIAWSYLFGNRIVWSILILSLLSTLLYHHEPLHVFSEQKLFGSMSDTEDCESAKLFRIKDKCLFHKGVTENNIEVCDLISANSLDFKKDCRDFIFRNRGSRGGDKKWCSFITSSYQKKLCYD